MQSIHEESVALLGKSPTPLTLVSDSHYQATPTILKEGIKPGEKDQYVEVM